MPRRWLSFWNQTTRKLQRQGRASRASQSSADIWVPYGEGQLQRGDVVYCVAIEAGQLRLYARLTVGRIATDPDHQRSLDIWAERDTDEWWMPYGTPVPDAQVDALIYEKSDGARESITREGATKRLLGYAFQGPASLRELVAGYEALDQL